MEASDIDSARDSVSSLVTPAVLVAALAILTVWYFSRRPDAKNIPPGPRGLPFYGHLLDLKKSATGVNIVDLWAEQYGPIYTIRLGSYPAVVLNSPAVIREAFVKHGKVTSARATNMIFFRYVTGSHGIIQNEGDSWVWTRRMTLHALRDLGMGRRTLEHRVQEEARALIDSIDLQGGKPFDPRKLLHNAFANVICSLLFGDRYEYGDPDFQFVANRLNIVFSQGGFKNPEIFMPLTISFAPLTNPGLVQVGISAFLLRRYLTKRVGQYRASYKPGVIRNFVDIFIKAERENNQVPGNSLLQLIFDLFMAGSETSTTTMNWIMLYLTREPAVQSECRKHILEVFGKDTVPCTTERTKLVYVEATIREAQRLGNIAAYGVLHRATEDIEVGGFTVPKDYIIMCNFHHASISDQYWEEPLAFRPQRWIGADGQLLKHPGFIPFSLGPRECIGQVLAFQEMFIILVSLLQRYKLTPKDPNNPPPTDGVTGFTYAPLAYEIVMTRL